MIRNSWKVLALSLAGALILVANTLLWIALSRHWQVLADRQPRLQPAEAAIALQHTASREISNEFTGRLLSKPQFDAVVSELQRTTSAAGVPLRDLQIRPQPASADRLGRSEISLSFRGSYPQVKRVVSDVLSRFSQVTLQRLAASTGESATEPEFNLTLNVWSRFESGQAADGK